MRASDAPFLAGRILFGGFFLVSGSRHFLEADAIAAGAAAAGVPLPTLAAYGTGVLLLVGGASVLLGLLPRVGLAAIVLFFVGVTPVMHDFWALDGPERMLQTTFFLRNVALLGAALVMFAIPVPWTAGVGAWRPRRLGGRRPAPEAAPGARRSVATARGRP